MTHDAGLSGAPPSQGALARIRGWLADRSDHSLAQRMAGAAFLIRVASAALVYLTQIFLARWMGSFEFGIYVYVWTWVLLIGDLVHLGLATTAQRYIPEYTTLKSFDLLRGFLTGSRWFVFLLATLLALALCGVIRLSEPWINRYELIPLYLACLCLPFYALSNMLDGIARAYNWVNVALVPPYFLRPLILIALMVAAHEFGYPTNATTAMMAAVIACFVTAMVQLIVLQYRLSKVVERGPKAHAVGAWIATSLPIFMVWGFYTLLTYTDVLVLQQFRPPEEVAHYYAASKTLALVAFVYFSVAAAVAHKFTQYHVSGDQAGLAAMVASSVRWTFWPSLVATVVILALGRPFLWLFGPSFVAAYPLMFILAVGLLARASIGPAERLLNMLGEQRACMAVYATAFATNLGLCVLLAPRLGTVGAAIATASALVVESMLLFLVTRRRLGFHIFVLGRPSMSNP